MSPRKTDLRESAARHFQKRAGKYNRSSAWVSDAKLLAKIRRLAEAGPQARVLDIAIGTGMVARAFSGRAGRVIGLDICPEMASQAKDCADEIVLSPAERLPFKDNTFDACVCRQGLQFMDAPRVVAEIHRVLKPGGRVVLCHLTAYGARDKNETFLIQKLRNPSRRNFFMPGDFRRLLARASFSRIACAAYLTRESVNRWSDNGAITLEARARIKDVYRNASAAFKKIHKVRFFKDDVFDTMMMVLAQARKKGAA